MTDLLSPSELNSRAEQLGARLRTLRIGAQLTGQQLAETAELSQPKISKIERGKVLASPSDMDRLADALDIVGPERQRLIAEAAELQQHWRSWRSVHRQGLAAAQREVQLTERIATTVRYFQATVIPGLLQYRRYARELLMRANITGQMDIEDAVNVRMERQDILHSEDREFRFVLFEPALLTRFGTPDVMRIQLDLLVSISHLPNVSLGIISLDTLLPRSPMSGFGIFDESQVNIEMLHGESVLSDEATVALYLEVFREYESVARFDDEARQIIESALKHYS